MADRKIDLLEVRWYERRTPDIAGRWLAAAQQHLPEAVPRRFGETEPLRGRPGRDDFSAAYARAEGLFFLAGSPPIHHASLAAGRSRSHGPMGVHSLSAELPADDERVRRFALALAGAETMYVSASITRGSVLSGRTVYGPAEQPGEPYLAPLGEWLGLPPEPPAWCWFGPAYARLVRRQVTAEPVAGGLLYTGGPWVADRLRARLTEPEPSRRAAPRMPGGLRRSTLQLLTDALRRRPEAQ